jgi:hypothetical protein
MRYIIVLLTVTVMLVFAGPASAQSGCQEFAHQAVVGEIETYHPLGKNVVSFLAAHGQQGSQKTLTNLQQRRRYFVRRSKFCAL